LNPNTFSRFFFSASFSLASLTTLSALWFKVLTTPALCSYGWLLQKFRYWFKHIYLLYEYNKEIGQQLKMRLTPSLVKKKPQNKKTTKETKIHKRKQLTLTHSYRTIVHYILVSIQSLPVSSMNLCIMSNNSLLFGMSSASLPSRSILTEMLSPVMPNLSFIVSNKSILMLLYRGHLKK